MCGVKSALALLLSLALLPLYSESFQEQMLTQTVELAKTLNQPQKVQLKNLLTTCKEQSEEQLRQVDEMTLQLADLRTQASESLELVRVLKEQNQDLENHLLTAQADMQKLSRLLKNDAENARATGLWVAGGMGLGVIVGIVVRGFFR